MTEERKKDFARDMDRQLAEAADAEWAAHLRTERLLVARNAAHRDAYGAPAHRREADCRWRAGHPDYVGDGRMALIMAG